jgi:alpha-L-fucosidase 2
MPRLIAMPHPWKLWYDKPAEQDWNRALPLGGGRLGAMVFGNVISERIQLNEDSLWNGGPRDRSNPSCLETLPEIRRLLRQGKLEAAHRLINDAMAGVPDSMRCYEPLGDLLIRFDHPGLAKAWSPADLSNADGYIFSPDDIDQLDSYRRELDLKLAVAGVEYHLNGVLFRRRHFASNADNVLVFRFEADLPGAISFRLRIERGPRESYSTRYADACVEREGDALLMTGRAGGEDGVRFAACVRAAAEGGTMRIVGDTLIVAGATAVTLVLVAATTFRESNPSSFAEEHSRSVLARGWEALHARHLEEYGRYFERLDLHLGNPEAEEAAAAVPTDRRLERSARDQHDPFLVALYFHFARYLLISSSRPDSLPANLQGLWNQDFWPAWGSKYTININTQMNYWLAEPAHLSECHEPLFELIERMAKSGRRTAREMYGRDGFMAHHNTDLWADTAPTDRNLAATYWLMGGAWLSLHLWDHFDFTRDLVFLRRAYPLLKEASQFFLHFLIEDKKGRLVVSPTVSPENVYRLPNGECGCVAEGCSMDSQILDVLFRRTEAAAALLGTDKEFSAIVGLARAKLPQPSIGRQGQLMEWLEDYEEIEVRHRHVSHAFALFPGDLISPRQTPEWAQALRVTLERRGDEGTGWCMAWKACLWARLGDGDHALKLLGNLLNPFQGTVSAKKDQSYTGGGSFPNLFCAHPPFQIDGNLGGGAAILEMLLQSHETETDPRLGDRLPVLQLLPALPAAWPEGSVRGLRARGGFQIDFCWNDGCIRSGTISSSRGGSCWLHFGDKMQRLELKPMESISF